MLYGPGEDRDRESIDRGAAFPSRRGAENLKRASFDHPFYREKIGEIGTRGVFFSLAEITREYSYALIDPHVIEKIAAAVKRCGIVSVGAGNGYNEKLLADRGVDVIAFDLRPPPASQQWLEIIEGDEKVGADYPERALYLSYPDRPQNMGSEAVKAYLGAGGKMIVFVGEPKKHAFGSDEALYDVLDALPERGWKLKEHTLSSWPGIGRYPLVKIYLKES